MRLSVKTVIFFLLLCGALTTSAQVYQSHNISLISLSTPNSTDVADDQRRYSGCWGWYQASKNKEYAICGASNGTYFLDISAPLTPSVCGFIEAGALKGTYREMKTYQHYCYIVSDDSDNKKFQIVDMQYLPDSIHIVHNDTTLFKRGHTIWIDQDKMYIGAMLDDSLRFSPMTVFSLANPESPVLLRKLQQDLPLISYVHDMYVRNDTVYASCADQGLFILKFDPVSHTFSQLGSYTGYPRHGYNHSSFLTDDGRHLIFCDEVPDGLPIHLINVENLGNIQPVKDWHPMERTTPHNPYILGDFAVVSCYQDGLHIYDISSPPAINVVGYFDTYPQGGASTGDYGNSAYRGNWGAYPFLPSGLIIANDMQNGLFLLDPAAAYSTTSLNLVSLPEQQQPEANLIVYPNPASERIAVHYNTSSPSTLRLSNLLGQVVLEMNFSGALRHHLEVDRLDSGTYILSVTEQNRVVKQQKLIIHH